MTDTKDNNGKQASENQESLPLDFSGNRQDLAQSRKSPVKLTGMLKKQEVSDSKSQVTEPLSPSVQKAHIVSVKPSDAKKPIPLVSVKPSDVKKPIPLAGMIKKSGSSSTPINSDNTANNSSIHGVDGGSDSTNKPSDNVSKWKEETSAKSEDTTKDTSFASSKKNDTPKVVTKNIDRCKDAEKPVPAVKIKVGKQPLKSAKLVSSSKVHKGVTKRHSADSVKAVSSISAENATVGQILQEARVSCNLSLGQVDQETKINKEYIEAIEHDDYKHLPPAVYTNAYVKTLCGLYNIDPDETESILSNLRKESDELTVPEEFLQNLENEKQINFEEDKKFRRILWGTALVCGVVFFIAIGYFTLRYTSDSATGEGADVATTAGGVLLGGVDSKPFAESELEKIRISGHQIIMTELPFE